eukprot:SAG22_NODE_2263_length_2774_cov_6.118879_2_plen_343_part_00
MILPVYIIMSYVQYLQVAAPPARSACAAMAFGGFGRGLASRAAAARRLLPPLSDACRITARSRTTGSAATAAGNLASAKLSADGRVLEVTFADGSASAFDGVWLRDNCPASRLASGQRLFETYELTDDQLQAESVECAPGGAAVVVTWGAELGLSNGVAHRRSEFAGSWLREHSYSNPAHRAERRELACKGAAAKLWSAETFASAGGGGGGDGDGGTSLPFSEYTDVVGWHDAVVSDRRGQLPLLRQLEQFGFSIVRGGPAEPGTCMALGAALGYVRTTNYGAVFDVGASTPALPFSLPFRVSLCLCLRPYCAHGGRSVALSLQSRRRASRAATTWPTPRCR